ncbi:MAG: ArsR/SmtB family transcription factor [Ilumatobacteraceae bacterium]
MSAARQAASHDAVDVVAHALADRTRRGLLRLLRDGEQSAGQLAREFPHISRPAVSQHLRLLQEARLVTVRAAGNHRMYSARTEGLTAMWEYLDEMWADSLTRLKRAAEQAESQKTHRRGTDT